MNAYVAALRGPRSYGRAGHLATRGHFALMAAGVMALRGPRSYDRMHRPAFRDRFAHTAARAIRSLSMSFAHRK